MDHLLAKPEREPLQFDLDVANVPEDIVVARAAIKKAAEKLLFHWKTVPIVLPPSIMDDQSIYGDGCSTLNFKDLFVAPTFNEMDQIARDAKGNIRKLNRKQLACIQRAGEFEVESMNFPGQVHRWRLSQILQKGAYNTHESFLNDLSLSLKMLIIHAKDRFISPFFSLSESIKSLRLFSWQFLDILIGMSQTKVHNLSAKLLEEHSRFLVAELDIKPGSRQEWVAFCNYIKEKCRETKVKKHEVKFEEMQPPRCPYVFLTPSAVEIDMRLFGRDLFAISSKIVKKILEQESSGWFIKYKDEIIKELKGQNMTHIEIKEHVQNSIQERYHERVFGSLLSNEELEKIEPGLANLLVAQAKCAIFIERNLYSVKEKFVLSEEEFNASLVKKYPVRSRIKQWMDRKLHQHGEKFAEQHTWDAHHQSIDDCRVHGLEQMMYFIYRDLIFMRDREPVLKKELSKVKVPCREFTFVRHIWSPKNWIVKKTQQGETEVVPTVVSSTYFLSTGHQHSLEQNDTTFDMEKTKKYKTNSSYAFWRVMNFFHRAIIWTLNVMFLLGVLVPWFSPVSLRTLFSPHPFMSSFMLNPLNGEICPDPSSKRSTLISRLRKLWAHVKQSRHRFECEPETGFLGKSLSRHFNRFWNYVLKGFLGSVLMIVFFLPLCLICSFSCLTLAAAAPIWVPVGVLALHLFDVLIYDFDHPDDSNRWFYLIETVAYRLILHGILQPIVALLLAFIVLPTAAIVILLGGIVRRILRTIWDALMFHCIIKKRGRIPSQDGFIAKRIAGPGLASNYYYQVKPEQALAAVEARMEIHELDAWWESYSSILDQPKREYKKFVESCFSPFSAVLSDEGVYQKLVRETKDHQNVLLKHVESRKQKLHTGLSGDTQSRIRLTSRELKVVIAQTSKMLEEFYPVRVLNRIQKSEDKFWEEKRLDFRDWQGLALQLLTEAFSPFVTMPLEEIDTCFKLNVEHLNLKRYLDMLKAAEFRDDLDVVSTVHSPKGDIDVGPPSMDIKIFNPNHDFVNHVHNKEQEIQRRKKDKRNSFPEVLAFFERLLVPLPVAHPATVAVIIHNRDENRQPILHDYVCQLILTAAEGLPHVSSAVEPENIPNIATSSTLIRSTVEDQTQSPHLVTQEDSISNSGIQDQSNETTSPTMDIHLIQDSGDQTSASASSVKIDIPESSRYEELLKPMPRYSKTIGREECSASESFSLMQACQHSGTL